jgi:hypothetical protein
MGTRAKAEGEICLGWAMEDITPEGPVSLWGQYYERISEYVQSPLKVTALAIESINRNVREQVILVSIDLVYMEGDLQESLRTILKKQLPDFDVQNLILNVTHTHSSFNPGADSKHYSMLVDKLSKVAVTAWEKRQPGGISWDLEYEVIGHNRRVEFADGTTEMYGNCERSDFIGLEGPEDNSVKLVFCWDLNKKLTGIIMNVACPAQVTEAKYFVSADYWGELRKQIEKKYPGIYILPQIGASGDISPRDLPREYKLNKSDMWDTLGTAKIGKKLLNVIDRAFPRAKDKIETKTVIKHITEKIEIPTRLYSYEEYQKAKKTIKGIIKGTNTVELVWDNFLQEIKENEKIKEHGPWDNKLSDYGIYKKQEALVKQYEDQDKRRSYPVELHVIRIGDIAICTNPFELFAEYGLRIEGRSKAKLTFVVQLSAGDYAGYLPTQRAIEGSSYKGYSALVNSVGPEGGQALVDRTVNIIESIWLTN